MLSVFGFRILLIIGVKLVNKENTSENKEYVLQGMIHRKYIKYGAFYFF